MSTADAELPGQIRLVLERVAEVATERMGSGFEAERLLGSTEGLRTLLPLLQGSAGLRALLRRELAGRLDDDAAADLVAADDGAAERAIAN
ncbi:MAG TPA: hypothetical protein VE172_00365, partial [Stackebrandtia sp.]|uniref:hypothetical protein n=1 Tax=Stackebrandtia sp. TaxID=2023065 RepID=UPI002D480A07